MNFNEPPLWTQMQILAGIKRWRIAKSVDLTLPDLRRGSRESWYILGQEWHFHHRSRVETILRLIEDHLSLDPMTWRWQAYFFLEFFRSFFRDCDDPAWVCLVPNRWSFPQRIVDVGGRPKHTAQLGQAQFRLSHLGAERLWLNDTSVSTTRLRMFHRGAIRRRDLQLQQVFVHRALRNDGWGRPLWTTEEWLFLVEPSIKELKAAGGGFNLNIEAFRDEITGLQTSPIVTLCRLGSKGQQVIARAFTLTPEIGEVIDIRPLHYSTEYLFRSNRMNPTMLRQLLRPGEFELLHHG